MHKIVLLVLVSLFSFGTFAQSSNPEVIPKIKRSLISYVLNGANSQEAYSKIKIIGLDAISFVQSQGRVSSKELDDVVLNVSRELEHDAVFLNKDQIVHSIISAINS